MRFGQPRTHLASCDSTNTVARELAAEGAPGGAVVTADEQTAGRGRQGHSWFAPPGAALLYSAILRPLEPRHSLLPLAVPLAVCDAVEEVSDRDCLVKWPNDVWIGGRKCAGVLIEARPRDGWAVIGVGLNVSVADGEFPEELRPHATSIGGGAGVEEALVALNRSLGRWVASGPGQILGAFADRDALAGREIAWRGAAGAVPDGRGTAAGVDERGNLVVEAGGERLSLGAGEVSLGSPGAT
ncbi:MAG: biotin--[acetyl-CoA-carboxylase] ligase [Solirubrobacterales bacterium]